MSWPNLYKILLEIASMPWFMFQGTLEKLRIFTLKYSVLSSEPTFPIRHWSPPSIHRIALCLMTVISGFVLKFSPVGRSWTHFTLITQNPPNSHSPPCSLISHSSVPSVSPSTVLAHCPSGCCPAPVEPRSIWEVDSELLGVDTAHLSLSMESGQWLRTERKLGEGTWLCCLSVRAEKSSNSTSVFVSHLLY